MTIFTVQPQRRNQGWHPCTLHQAERFAVLQVRPAAGRNKPRHEKVLAAFPTRAQAQEACDNLIRNHQRRKRKADAALEARRPVLLRSLTQQEYRQLQQSADVAKES